MNWTTTTVPLWQIDCDNFRRVGRPFELRDVSSPEHQRFINAFAKKNRLKIVSKGNSVIFKPAETPALAPNAARE